MLDVGHPHVCGRPPGGPPRLAPGRPAPRPTPGLCDAAFSAVLRAAPLAAAIALVRSLIGLMLDCLQRKLRGDEEFALLLATLSPLLTMAGPQGQSRVSERMGENTLGF